MPPWSQTKGGENDGPSTDSMITDLASNGLPILNNDTDNGEPVRRWFSCGRLFATERGLKVHQTKSNCGCEASRQHTIAKLQIGKTPDDTGPESHHSSERVRVSRQGQDLPKSQDRFTRGNDKRGWSGLDEELKQGLKKSLKDGSVKSFSDFIYNKCIERFRVVPVKRLQEKDSRRQRELGRLKGKKKALRRRWKVAREDKREGLSVLWEDVKRQVRDLRRAERGRQRKYERNTYLKCRVTPSAMSLYSKGWTSRRCRCRPVPFAWRLLCSRRWEELWGKRETDQSQDPTEFSISYIKDVRKHYICCIPSFRERGRRPRSIMMNGRRQKASIFHRRKTSKVWINSDQYRCWM